MSPVFSIPRVGGRSLPVRRVLAVDAGSRRIKLLLAQTRFGHLRLLRQEMIDLQAEGLVSADEVKVHLQDVIADWGSPPLALSLPQHTAISQVLDLPVAPESEIEKLIADESIKLGGVTESRIIYDFVKTDTVIAHRQQFWVTLAQDREIRDRLGRLGVDQDSICEITTTANSLISAYRATAPASSGGVLVHMGAETTVLVIVLGGHGAFAGSVQIGGEAFTRSIARIRHCTEETAEALKSERNLLAGPDALPEFSAVVDNWAVELSRQIAEWLKENASFESAFSRFDFVASGGGFDQPGLLEYFRAKTGLDFEPWPHPSNSRLARPAKGFEVAFGTALQALGHTEQPVSLLPEDYRLAWRKRQTRQKVELASLGLVIVCVLLLAMGTWHKLTLIGVKQAMLAKVQAGQDAVEANQALTSELLSEYENLRPIFADQRNTLDTLKAFALLQQSRSNREFWYVLLSDQQSYFDRPAPVSTNRPARTNAVSATAADPPRTSLATPRSTTSGTNLPGPPRPGIIAELCVPGDADSARQTLSKLVFDLKQNPLFSNVDLLSEDLRRNHADPKVLIPDRHYALALDFEQVSFQQPTRPKKSPGRQGKRGPRESFIGPDLDGQPGGVP